MLTWHRSKLFYTDNDGLTWSEVNYGAWEDRGIQSVYVNPYDLDDVWVGEGGAVQQDVSPPAVYHSTDGGATWRPNSVQMVSGPPLNGGKRIITITRSGRVFLGSTVNLLYSDDGGATFQMVNLDPDISFGDPSMLVVHPTNPNALYMQAPGIGYTADLGATWTLLNKGLVTSTINLLAADPVHPGVVYATSPAGEGIFRTDDSGETWTRLKGYKHQFADELNVDPNDPGTVWYVGDVPYLNKSTDKGETWSVLNEPDQGTEGGSFSFNSIYAMAQPAENDDVVYVLNNGFGIYKGTKVSAEKKSWSFLDQSEVDYSYSIAMEPKNPNTLYSGYTRKYFQKKAMIRGSYDGGSTWFTALEIDSAEAVTSVVVDAGNTNTVYAASSGEIGGGLWKSGNKGKDWTRLNDYFNFTTIHSFAVPSDGSGTLYAGVWGGGLYKNADHGSSWSKLDSSETFSVASVVVDPQNSDVVYAADRTKPTLYRSLDGGGTWSEFFKLGVEYRRLMSVTIEPTNSAVLYVSAMKAGGPGRSGGLFKLEDGVSHDIGDTLPKVVLNVMVDPSNPAVVYAVLHESGVYKSTNGGAGWTELSGVESGLPDSGFSSIVRDPSDPSTLYLIGGCDVRFDTFASAGLDPDLVNSVYRSRDGGLSWENINRSVLGSQSGAIKSLGFYKNRSNVIYLGAENGVYYSTDAGDSWQKSAGLPYSTLGGVGLVGDTIYAFTNGAGAFRGSINSDNSITWDSNQEVVARVHFAQILLDPVNTSTIYASGYPGGVFKSIDGGSTWHEANFGLPSFAVEDPLRQGYYALDLSRSNSQVLYLGLFGRGVYKSINGAGTWMPMNGTHNEMYDRKIASLVVDPSNDQNVYVATDEGVFGTDDGGSSWSQMNTGLGSTDVKVLSINEKESLYAGTRGYGLYSWTAGSWVSVNPVGRWGVIWPIWNNRPSYQYTSQLIHRGDSEQMLIGTFPQGIYKSVDGGDSWRESNTNFTVDGVFKLVSHPQSPDMVYCGTYNGINRSTDFGEHWEKWNEGWPSEQWVFSIDFDRTNPEIMYACSKNGENEGTGRDGFNGIVMKSTDGGKNWFEIMNGLARGQEFYGVVVDRFDPQTVYLAHETGGISRTQDGGDTWAAWNEGLTNTHPGTNKNNVTSVLVLSADYSTLFFGSGGSGVFRRALVPTGPPAIIVVSPNGDESWTVGSSREIAWASAGGVGNVKIEYTTGNEGVWSTIAESVPNGGRIPGRCPTHPRARAGSGSAKPAAAHPPTSAMRRFRSWPSRPSRFTRPTAARPGRWDRARPSRGAPPVAFPM